MIKRRFYRHDHGDRDVPSDSSSSSSDSERQAEPTEDEVEREEEDVVVEVRQHNGHSSSSSGYESEDSSANEVDLDSAGLSKNEDDSESEEEGENVNGKNLSFDKRKARIVEARFDTNARKEEIPSDLPSCVLKSKSVFKCKLCPRIVCLTKETLRAHIKSKRHTRSEKLLSEGRLKLMLNSDGEIETGFEEEGETHQERHASTLAAAARACQNSTDSRKRNKGRQRQRKRIKKNTGEDLTSHDTKSTKKPLKKGEDLTSDDTKSTKKPLKKRRKSNT